MQDRIESNQPDPDEIEAPAVPADASPIRKVTAEQFLQNAQNPNGPLPGLNKYINELKERTGADNRSILRCCLYLLQVIATTVPWNDQDGIDSQMLDSRNRILMPSWRECIGALLGEQYSKPTPSDPDDPHDDAPREPLHRQPEADGAGDEGS